MGLRRGKHASERRVSSEPASAPMGLRRASPPGAPRLAARASPFAFAALAVLVFVAPWLAPYGAGRQFSGYPYAPPMRPHLVDDQGAWHAPFAYPVHVVDLIERRYAEDRTRRVTLSDFHAPDSAGKAPWFLLGSDGLGRDVLSRVLAGARLSLGVSVLATLLALLIGAAAGASAGYAGGWVDATLMRIADFVIVLPGIYVVLALRGAMLLDAGGVQVCADAPWLLTPAAAIVLTVFVIHSVASVRHPLLWDHNPG